MHLSSGETNFCADDASTAIDRIIAAYRADALSIDETDGISLSSLIGGSTYANQILIGTPKHRNQGKSDLLEYQVNSIAKLLGELKLELKALLFTRILIVGCAIKKLAKILNKN